MAPILDGEDTIVAAPTAAGKTEAAFFPICTALKAKAGTSVQALVVSPLKALINDQYDRLQYLCEGLDIAVHRWHGDVPQGEKTGLRQTPGGILIITPESLEAMFVNRGSELPRYFCDLQYVVVDELHAFIGSERGKQLQSLLWRLECHLKRRVPRIGLSATLGDMGMAALFLRPTRPSNVRLLESAIGGQGVEMVLKGYLAREDPPQNEGEETARVTANPSIAEHLYDRLRLGKHLVFANARSSVELYADALRIMCEQHRVPNSFFPHHGSLSKEIRDETEMRLKDPSAPATAVCTSTLELGIDIGYVQSVCQIGVPPAVANLRQRLGRSGRRKGEASVLRFLVEERQVSPDTAPQDCIRAQLVQSVAMISLLLERWCEPPRVGLLHLSTLVQQVLSTIAQFGAVQPREAWQLLCATEPFSEVSQEDFISLLRSMGNADLIAQTADGSLMLGGKGERIVNHYDFYAAFATPEEYRVMVRERTLGTVPMLMALTEGQYMIFAGRRWRVLAIDADRRIIQVEPAVAGKAPLFCSGAALVADRIRQQMLTTYLGADVPAYLDPSAVHLLAEGREWFRRLRLDQQSVISYGADCIIFPWTGDTAMNALTLMLARAGMRVARDGVAITACKTSPEDLAERLRSLWADGAPDPIDLAACSPIKQFEKYHWCLTEDLLNKDYARAMLDVDQAWAVVQRLAHQSG